MGGRRPRPSPRKYPRRVEPKVPPKDPTNHRPGKISTPEQPPNLHPDSRPPRASPGLATPAGASGGPGQSIGMRAALPRRKMVVSTFFCFPIQIRFVRAENPGWNGNQRSWGQKSVGGPMRRERVPVKRRTGPISAPSGQAAGNCS